jgi:pyrroline-5-carboxylate reductase
MAVADARAHERIGFVGGGNMAEALIRGIIEAGVATPDEIHVGEPREARRAYLEATHGVRTSDDNAAVVAACGIVVLAVKPDTVPVVLQAVRGSIDAGVLLVSICAGVRSADIEAGLPRGARVVRAMPNTAAMARAAATAIAAGSSATDNDLATARRLFEAVGRCVVVPEHLLDAVTGLSGSGPAYVMLVIEALAAGGVQAGLPHETAQLLAAQTVYGAAKLQLETGDDPAQLRERVTSPGGTTVAGLGQLEAAREMFVAAVLAATARSRQLGGEAD